MKSFLLIAVFAVVPVSVFASDGTVTPEVLCREYAGQITPQCRQCAKRILPRANEAVDRCEARCAKLGTDEDRFSCDLDCMDIYKTHFTNNCLR